jgi:hypothetical protein
VRPLKFRVSYGFEVGVSILFFYGDAPSGGENQIEFCPQNSLDDKDKSY